MKNKVSASSFLNHNVLSSSIARLANKDIEGDPKEKRKKIKIIALNRANKIRDKIVELFNNDVSDAVYETLADGALRIQDDLNHGVLSLDGGQNPSQIINDINDKLKGLNHNLTEELNHMIKELCSEIIILATHSTDSQTLKSNFFYDLKDKASTLFNGNIHPKITNKTRHLELFVGPKADCKNYLDTNSSLIIKNENEILFFHTNKLAGKSFLNESSETPLVREQKTSVNAIKVPPQENLPKLSDRKNNAVRSIISLDDKNESEIASAINNNKLAGKSSLKESSENLPVLVLETSVANPDNKPSENDFKMPSQTIRVTLSDRINTAATLITNLDNKNEGAINNILKANGITRFETLRGVFAKLDLEEYSDAVITSIIKANCKLNDFASSASFVAKSQNPIRMLTIMLNLQSAVFIGYRTGKTAELMELENSLEQILFVVTDSSLSLEKNFLLILLYEGKKSLVTLTSIEENKLQECYKQIGFQPEEKQKQAQQTGKSETGMAKSIIDNEGLLKEIGATELVNSQSAKSTNRVSTKSNAENPQQQVQVVDKSNERQVKSMPLPPAENFNASAQNLTNSELIKSSQNSSPKVLSDKELLKARNYQQILDKYSTDGKFNIPLDNLEDVFAYLANHINFITINDELNSLIIKSISILNVVSKDSQQFKSDKYYAIFNYIQQVLNKCSNDVRETYLPIILEKMLMLNSTGPIYYQLIDYYLDKGELDNVNSVMNEYSTTTADEEINYALNHTQRNMYAKLVEQASADFATKDMNQTSKK